MVNVAGRHAGPEVAEITHELPLDGVGVRSLRILASDDSTHATIERPARPVLAAYHQTIPGRNTLEETL